MGLVQAKIDNMIETSPQLIDSLHMAREMALEAGIAEVLPVHLALAMLEDEESSFLLEAYGVDFDKTRIALDKLAKKHGLPKTDRQHAVFSASIETLMLHAREQAQKNALGEVDSNLILAVLLSEKNGFFGKLLQPYDLDTSGVLQYLELREGKTIDIDPLPCVQKKVAPPEQMPKKQPAPAPTTKAIKAPLPKPAPRPQSLEALVKPAKPIKQPAVKQQPPAQNDNPKQPAVSAAPPTAIGQPLAPAEPSRPAEAQKKTSAAPLHSPEQKVPTNASSQKPASLLSAASLAPPAAPLPVAGPATLKKPAPPTAPEKPASSRLRSIISGVGKAMKNKAAKSPEGQHPTPLPKTASTDSSGKMATPAQIRPATPSAPPGAQAPVPPSAINNPGELITTAANNNQSTPAAKTELAPPPPAPLPDGVPAHPQPVSPSPLAPPPPKPALAETAVAKPQSAPLAGPSTQSVDTLINRPTPPQPTTKDPHQNPASPQLLNRPAKRRRSSPSSLGAHESLSATGSVLEKGRLVENVPRKMKINKASRAEVRITRTQMDEISDEFAGLSSSHIHELAVTEAMTVQLRAPGSGFHIENLSPQTQWIDRNQRHIDDADFGVWRWNVTPTKSGKARLQLVISARTVDDEGTIHIADVPDKIIELSVCRDRGLILKKAGILVLMALASLALGRYGETAYQWLSTLTKQLG